MTSNFNSHSTEFLERAQSTGIIPVITIPDASLAEPLADALFQAGVSIVEITLRTTDGAQAIRQIRQANPHMLVGAGTVLSPSDVALALDAGAMFALSPSTSIETLIYAAGRSLTYVPGVMTPTDVNICLQHHVHVMKFFPATQAGGPGMLSALNEPFKHLDIKMIPTGGVTEHNIDKWYELECVVAIGGSWIVSSSDLKNRAWEAIYQRAKQALSVAASLRH